MYERILRLGKDASIYGLSSIIGRFLNFLLVPFYTHYLAPAEYGVVATLYSYIAFAFIIYGYGMESAFMRYVASQQGEKRKKIFTVPFLSVFATSLVLSLLFIAFSESVSFWIGLGTNGALYVQLAAAILFFDALVIIPFAALRMDHKAKAFAGWKIFNIVVNVLANIFLLVFLKMKVEGVLLANLIASLLTVAVLSPSARMLLTFDLPKGLYSQLLKFGLPYVPAGLASVAMHVVDRPILKSLTDEATVGIYQANYRLGIVMMLVVSMFDYAWRPFYLSHYQDSDAKQLFSKVFTYFMTGLGLVFVVVTLFVEDLIRISFIGAYFFHPDYWSGVVIVPWILFAYMFAGAYSNFIVGVTIEKKTQYLPVVTGLGAVANVAANYLLIPIYGMMGAAYATLISYVVMAVGIYIPSNRLFHIEYEWGKIFRIALAIVGTITLFLTFAPSPMTVEGIAAKVLLMAMFLVLLFVLRVIDISSLLQFARQVRSSKDTPENL